MVRLLSKHQVSDKLGYHPEHVMRLARQGKFPQPVKLGDHPNCAVRFDEAEVDAYIAGRMAARAAGAADGC